MNPKSTPRRMFCHGQLGLAWMPIHFLIVAGLFALALALSAQSTGGTCDFTVFLEYKMASTNRVKTGMPGFLNATNSNTPELLVYRTYRHGLNKEIIGDSCSYGIGVDILRQTNVSRWPTDYDPADLRSGIYPSCGYLPPTLCRDEFAGYWYQGTGGGSCSNFTLCGVPQTSNACPRVWYFGSGFQSSVTASTTNNTERYQLTSITNYSSAQPDHCLDVSGFLEQKEILSDLYTTDELVSHMAEDIESMLDDTMNWSCTGEAALSLSDLELCGHMSQCKFRYQYFGSQGMEADIILKRNFWVQYHSSKIVTWSVITTNHVVGDGTVVVSDEELLTPYYASGVKSSFVSVKLLSPASAACSASPGFAQVQVDLNDSPTVQFGLGDCTTLAQPGLMLLQLDDPEAALTEAPALQIFSNPCLGGTVGSNPMQQVLVQDGLAEITRGAQSFDIAFYSTHGALNDGTGLYDILPASLLSAYHIAWTRTAQDFRLRVSNPQGWFNEFIHTNGWWMLHRGDGLGFEGRQQAVDVSNQILIKTRAMFDEQGQTLLREVSTFSLMGGSTSPRIQSRIAGVGSEATTNLWLYYAPSPSNHLNTGKLLLTIDSHGGWERHEYSPVTGLKTKTIRPFGNADTNALESACRVFEYSYAPFHPQDDGSLESSTPRVVCEYVLGRLAKMSGTALWASNRLQIAYGRLDQRFPDPTDYANPANQLTAIRMLTFANGRGSRTIAPDGQVTFNLVRTNSAGTLATNLLYVGFAEDMDPKEITVGTLNSTLESIPDGKVLAVASYEIQTDQPALLLSRSDYTYVGHGSNAFTRIDLDGTSESYTHSSCCGWERVVDRDRVETSSHYDARHRLIATSRLGVMISNVLDHAGQVRERWRVPSQGQAVRLQAFTYDSVGRIQTETDALGRLTTHRYTRIADGRFLHATQHPDGSWSQEYHNRDGTLERTVGTAEFPVRYDYNFDDRTWGECTREIKLDAAGRDTLEITSTSLDWFGRTVATRQGHGAESRMAYPSMNRQILTDPDGVVTILERTSQDAIIGIDLDRDGTLDSRVDRRTRLHHDYSSKTDSDFVRRTIRYQWNDAGFETGVATNELSLDGLRSWRSSFDGTYHTETAYASAGTRTQTLMAPDGTTTVSMFQFGRLIVSKRLAANGVPLAETTFGYDAHGRQSSATNQLTGMVTSRFYDLADQVVSNVVAAPGQPVQITRFTHDQVGRIAATDFPDGSTQFRQYFPTGLLKSASGNRIYPVEFSYDAQGRLATAKTWQDHASASGAAVTLWKYDGATGLLTNKLYPDGSGIGYAYTPGGRLKNRTWARGRPNIVTTYTYGFDDAQPANNHGDLVRISYDHDPTKTPDVAFAYDRRGRLVSVAQGEAITAIALNDAGQRLHEWHAAGPLNRLGVTNTYDELLRRRRLSASAGAETLTQHFHYDAGSRLAVVTQGDHSAAYSYIARSGLVGQIDFRRSNQVFMTSAKHYDSLNRLTHVVSTPMSLEQSPMSFSYTFNRANQRISTERESGTQWLYQFDPLGQLIGAKNYWLNGVPIPGQQFQYDYDDIGNRRTAAAGGNAWGMGLRFEHYAANHANQYTSRTLPSAVDIIGEADPDATVTVNNQPAWRRGDYFRAEVATANAEDGVWLSLTNVAVMPGDVDSIHTIKGNLFLPQSPEVLVYDADGNVVEDGRWHYVWDAENRCVAVETAAAAARAGVPRQRLEFLYDWQGRRIRKTVSHWADGTWVTASQRKFLYDGWNLIAELDHRNQHVRSYAWGVDVSGSPKEAAGVGGLLFVTETDPNRTYAVCDDGYGNVSGLVDTTDGIVAAAYAYGPFGETIGVRGSKSLGNPFRFGTKYADAETGLLMFPLRLLNPSTGRFLTRDPIGEAGGWNVYAYVANNPLGYVDPLGDDFIAVSDRPVKGTLGLFYHYSIQYWISCDDIDLNTEFNIQSWLTTHVAKKSSSTELLADEGWKVWRLDGGTRWRVEDVKISVIHYDDAGTKFAAIYKGTPQQVRQQWAKVLQQARGYKYAEQVGFNGAFQNWPNSKYEIGDNVNNSNTFIRDIVAKSGLKMQELAGSHPGRHSPEPVPDFYHGQLPFKGPPPPRPHVPTPQP